MPVIRQEEERRKRRVATRVAAGALMLVVVLSALLPFALVQRQRAEQNVFRRLSKRCGNPTEYRRTKTRSSSRRPKGSRDPTEYRRGSALAGGCGLPRTAATARAEREHTPAEAKSLGLGALRDFDSGRQIEALIDTEIKKGPDVA